MDSLEWETLESEVAYTCPGFHVRNERVRLPDGAETDFDYVDEPESVVILPFTPDGAVVVIEEWRQAVRRVNRGLPAGTLDPGEGNPATAARRELTEETGYEADTVEHLATVEPLNGVANAVHHHYAARGCRPSGEQALDHDESIRVRTTSFDDLRAAVRDNEIRDGRTVLAVLHYGATDG